MRQNLRLCSARRILLRTILFSVAFKTVIGAKDKENDEKAGEQASRGLAASYFDPTQTFGALSPSIRSRISPSPLGSGRVIRQSLPLGETRRLVPVSPTTFATTVIYGFRKSGKSWIWPWANFRCAARIRACDTSIASSR
ncbi:hypothetical protein DdX_18240 [Ditylenchus destructor]|uniref:Uncharacterized protein n=1 Tax=Ditylenchus destructor TaxID=166010 RepID=A0AAD4QV31_9BILA|nr:hypothetical protein DdX_18240 [Ditylenchus destructor]